MTETDLSPYRELFVEEVQEYLQSLNQALLRLERAPSEVEPLNEIFRLAHTIKGMAATMGYDDMAHLAHVMEDLLDELRQGRLRIEPSLFDLLFACLDALENMLEGISSGGEGAIDLGDIVSKLGAYRALAERDGRAAEQEPPSAPRFPTSPTQPMPTLPRWVRINVRHLDSLMTLVEELVINRSWLMRIQAQHDISILKEPLEQHGRILAELRDTVLHTRLVPMAQVFNRFPRMIRDLLKQEGKEAEFIIEGREIELDRAILERISDSLVHLLRNAVSHGIEPPEERKRAGKLPMGTIRLAAWRERDQVVIEVSDDGRGMDRRRIAETAVARELVTPEELAEMSDQEVLMLICHPRFSMTPEVTHVAGRGVGMDVVRRAVEKLRGSLEILSTPGKGSTFRLRLPLTLAIIQALLVEVGSEVYAIPSSYIQRTVAVEPYMIKPIQQHAVLMLEESLPLFDLRALLQVPQDGGDSRYAVVVERDHQRVGLLVDSLIDQEEIVIKSLPGFLGRISGLAGATILGEGQVVLILDIPSLV